MLSILSILLWVFALLLRGISSPDGGCRPSFRPGYGRDAVLSLHDNGVRSAVAVVFCAAPILSMPRVSSLSWLAISVSFSGRHSQMAQGHGLDNPWITGLSTVVYSLWFFWATGAAVFWVAPFPPSHGFLQWCYVSPVSAAPARLWCIRWPPRCCSTAVVWPWQFCRSLNGSLITHRWQFCRSLNGLLIPHRFVLCFLFTFDMKTMPYRCLCLTLVSVWQVFQRWRLGSARVSHFPPLPWWLDFFPVSLELLPMSFLDSGTRIWVGSGSCLSPIGNPAVLVGRLLVGWLIQPRNHVCDGFWADLKRDHHYLGWRFPFPGRRPLHCRDAFVPMDRPSIRPSVGFLDHLFAWIFLSRATCFYLGNLCGSYLFSDVHGLCLRRLLTAWSMQAIFSPAFLFLDLHPFSGSCRYSFPLLPRATFPLASWRLLHHGLCPYLSRWLPWSIYYSFSTHLQRMASDLIHSMENLQFTEAESESVVVEPPCEAGDSGLWLVGSVISSKAVDGDSVCRIFRSVLKSKNIIDILELRPNFFLIKPVMAAAKDMILKRRPWIIHEDLFSIEPYNPDWHAVDFSFTNMVIWVRVYQLPLRAMNGSMGLQLGATIGKAIGVDHRVEGGNFGEFLRIKVSIDITKPLRRCILLGNGQGRKPSPCPLKYERLPRFCYHCGLLGHDLAACSTKPPDLDVRKLQYGSWLRVSAQNPVAGSRRKQGIEYFDTRGEAAEAVGVAEGQSSARTEVAGTNDKSGEATEAEFVDTLNAGSGPYTVEKGSAAQVLHAVGNMTTPRGPVDSVQSDQPCPVVPTRAEEATVSDVHGQVGRAEPKVPMPVAKGDVFEGCQAVVAPEPDLPAEFADPALPKLAAVLGKSIGGAFPNPALPLIVSTAMGTNPVRAKRTLQGKYEVCTPFLPKRTRLHSPGPLSFSDPDDKQAEVAGVAMRYFSSLFSSSQPTPNSTLLSNIDHCISSDDNISLLRPFTDAEILAAFQDINPTKAPGIDGLPGSFFRQHWELIGSDILQLCHDHLSRKIDMSCVNATVITLIPKVEDPVRMQQLRPISLCTVVYKIVSKTILNRMKPLLPGCISENQSAFLKGRLISDNILVAHELLH
ncbi:hypothetical protein V6N13_040403 [Hibiscus sabdariffa]